jgi:hypothetical protein
MLLSMLNPVNEIGNNILDDRRGGGLSKTGIQVWLTWSGEAVKPVLHGGASRDAASLRRKESKPRPAADAGLQDAVFAA